MKGFFTSALALKIKNKITFVLLLIISQTILAGDVTGLRGQRYCEIIVAQKSFLVSVYNTIMLNNCPENLWSKIMPEQIKKETDSMFVMKNGPRYWVLDGFQNTQLINQNIVNFGGIDMREAGRLHLHWKDIIEGTAPYRQHTVDRKTTCVYLAGKPIYELISPEHQVYVMQSYSIEKNPQTEASLSTLGSKLTLPKGWVFKTGILSKDRTILAVNEQAEVVQDDYLNTYQLATEDFLG